MIDLYGRKIDYMRISVTDRCNLRCRYCMPEDVVSTGHDAILRYEEMLHLCALAVKLGITKFKITGGEPLVRRGCEDFIAQLKRLDGVEQVTLTTNGLLLEKSLDALCAAGLDGVNISLDTLDEKQYHSLCGSRGSVTEVLAALRACVDRGLRTKINAVLLEDTLRQAEDLAALAEKLPVDVRFIELMPIGHGADIKRVSPDEMLRRLKNRWPDLRPTDAVRGNGPAHYYESDALQGKIGLIDAVSHKFCEGCNRVRLTSTGQLKPCLCYNVATDLRSLLREGCSDDELLAAMKGCIAHKPKSHSFDRLEEITEKRIMSQIGG